MWPAKPGNDMKHLLTIAVLLCSISAWAANPSYESSTNIVRHNLALAPSHVFDGDSRTDNNLRWSIGSASGLGNDWTTHFLSRNPFYVKMVNYAMDGQTLTNLAFASTNRGAYFPTNAGTFAGYGLTNVHYYLECGYNDINYGVSFGDMTNAYATIMQQVKALHWTRWAFSIGTNWITFGDPGAFAAGSGAKMLSFNNWLVTGPGTNYWDRYVDWDGIISSNLTMEGVHGNPQGNQRIAAAITATNLLRDPNNPLSIRLWGTATRILPSPTKASLVAVT